MSSVQLTHPGIDADRWPDVARVPATSGAARRAAALLVRHAVARLPLCVEMPDGRRLGAGGPTLEVRDADAFHARLAADGLVGFGESHLAGEWEAPDLVAVLTVLAEHVATLVPGPLQRLRGLWAPRQPDRNRNTPDGSRRNIAHHYDLSNDLFALFLDETMTYSSGIFHDLPADHGDLVEAQHRKIDRLLDLAEVGPGTDLLEIGTGWGELALRAAARGALVTTVTLSAEQRDLARRRVAAAGLADLVSVELRDYRELTGRYDAVVSVEMIEAVGAEFWPGYFERVHALLRPGGLAAIQAITMPHDRMLASRDTHTWIRKYIFPGGQLPSVEAVETSLPHGLHTVRRDAFGPHYAQTLRLWEEAFTARADEVARLGFDDVFRRMWRFYLAYSEAGFRAGYLDLQQFLLRRDPAAAPVVPEGR
ncbi:class I SAM-dependent methyltransferase [Streptomyces alkaliterrae]|uniref:Class I SAM-dependent methyltransferase n=1 Tax=Streptomyces alkaliterrae TaxID=2213162 RepID=A0A5P0YK01_9ACTN|nr:class I SAM-dependent methyltransferase [Streptomyces alkaliterrae]MBB1257706.1 class I SAM-dependent methyltransferase [Streptomyces alkaliterrae]MQS00645.1 methyltransferase domain-containing protein [Streptomyces alkaliterrae]